MARSDSAGIALVSFSGQVVDELPEWTVASAPELTLGDSAEVGGYAFLGVSGVMATGDSEIVVANDATKDFKVFGPDGTYRRSVGRNGSGPGEFRHLQQVPSEDPTLLVGFDALQQRISLFTSSGRFRSQWSLAGKGLGAIVPVALLADSTVILRTHFTLPDPTEKGTVRGPAPVLRVSLDGAVLDTIGWFRDNEMVLRTNARGGLTGGEPPFPARLLIAVHGGDVWVGPGEDYEWRRYDRTGRLQVIVRSPRRGAEVTRSVREAYRARVLSKVQDEYGIREWTMLSNDDVFPERYPPYDRVALTSDGELMVRDHPVPGTAVARWVVFGRDGVPIARFSLDAGFAPMDIAGDRLLGVWRDQDNVEHVRVYRMTR